MRAAVGLPTRPEIERWLFQISFGKPRLFILLATSTALSLAGLTMEDLAGIDCGPNSALAGGFNRLNEEDLKQIVRNMEISSSVQDEVAVNRAPASFSTSQSDSTLEPSFVPKLLPINFDSHGLIVQADGDGGDTAQREGMFYFAYDDQQGFEQALDQLEVEPGIYVRNPYQEGYNNDPADFSRDQERALVIAMGSYKMYERLGRLLHARLTHFGKYQNTDIMGPVNVGEYIRAFHAGALYPVLFITDFELLGSSLEIAISGRLDSDSVDDNNQILALLQAQHELPTPISWVARKVYKWSRPDNRGNSVIGETDPVQGALSWYHRSSTGGNPLLAEVYRNAVRDL